MPELAPWLQINPLAGVPMYLQGFGQGASVGESRRRSEERAYEADLQAAAQQERNEILREARQLQAKEFAENLKLKQEQAQRAAKMAAIRLEGQQGLERGVAERIARGETPQQAFQSELPRHAPKLLFEEPASMAQLMRTLSPDSSQYGEPTVKQLGGQDFAYVPGSASLQPIRKNEIPEGGIQAVPIVNPDTGEVTYGRPGPQGTVIPLPRGESKTATLRALRKEKRDLEKAKSQASLLQQDTSALDTDIASVQAEMDQLTQKATQSPQAKAKGDLVKISTKEEYDKLPAGTDYIAPDGSIRHKK